MQIYKKNIQFGMFERLILCLFYISATCSFLLLFRSFLSLFSKKSPLHFPLLKSCPPFSLCFVFKVLKMIGFVFMYVHLFFVVFFGCGWFQ